MAKIITPSASVTVAQIGKICDLLTAGLREAGLQSESTQQVIETQDDSLTDELVEVIRWRVEAINNLIVRRVTVNRGHKPQEMFVATDRKQYTDCQVIENMPRGVGKEIDVYFFKVGHHISDIDLEKEYARRDLVPVDPYSLAAVNEADLTFADTNPNGTHWKDANDKWCFAAFDRWRGWRSVRVDRYGHIWDNDVWFAGFRK